MQPKPLKLTPIFEEAVIGGATMFIEKIPKNECGQFDCRKYLNREYDCECLSCEEYLHTLRYQKCDKVFIQEEWNYCSIYPNSIIYKETFCKNFNSQKLVDDMNWQPKENMTFEQSRYKYEITDIKIVKTRKITPSQWIETGLLTNYEFEQNGWELIRTRFNVMIQDDNIDYDSNEYVALYTVKPI